MSDDNNDEPKINENPDNDDENVIHVEPIFDEKYTRNRSAQTETIKSRDDAVKWSDKYYATVIVDGKFRIINERDPTNIFLMTKKDFIDSLENLRILITSEDNKPKITPITEIWLKSQHRNYDRIIFDVSKPNYQTSLLDQQESLIIVNITF